MCPPTCPYADFSLTWKLLSLLFMSGAQCPVCELPTWNSEDLFYELNVMQPWQLYCPPLHVSWVFYT